MNSKLTNEEQVALIKDDLRHDLAHCESQLAAGLDADATLGLPDYANWCRDLLARTDWTAEQFINNRIPARS